MRTTRVMSANSSRNRRALGVVAAALIGFVTGIIVAILGARMAPAVFEENTREAADTSDHFPQPPAQLLDHEFDDVGVVVFDRTRSRITVAYNAEEQFTSASLVKLLIAFDALERGASESDVHVMIAESHDAIAGQLWVEGDGPALVTEWANRLGLDGTEAPEEWGKWGDTLTTAADMVKVYRYLLEEAPPRTREVVLAALRASTPYGNDGFYQRFGIPDAAGGLPVAVKQGWACCTDERVLHTSGLVGDDDRYIVAVLSRTSREVDDETVSRNLTSYVARVLDAAGVDRESPLPTRIPVRPPNHG